MSNETLESIRTPALQDAYERQISAVMSRASIRGKALIFAVALVLMFSASATAQTRKDAPEPDWIPGFNVGIEIFDLESENTIENLVNGPAWSTSEDDAIRQYIFTLGGELAGPAADSIPGHPRFVLGGGVGLKTSTENRLNQIGEPASATEPERDIGVIVDRFGRRQCVNPPNNCPTIDVMNDIDGQGSDLRLSFETMSWYADLGISFDVPIRDAAIVQIRPSLSYRGEKFKVQGRLTTVTIDPLLLGPGVTASDFVIHRSRPGEKNATHHHLGPRLELALVLSPDARPLRTTLFLHGSYLWLLSDPELGLMDTSGVATFRVKREQEAFRGGVGVRFSWMGIRSR
ncbi:MAG: hypothetical protein ACR2QQ_06935 [Gammaproteobacteria bacterium]